MKPKLIRKAGAILIKDKKFMLERHGGNDTYIIPGGKLEINETAEEALVRELEEEFHLYIEQTDLEKIGTFESQAVHSPNMHVQIDAFLVKKWSGEIKLDGGIENIIWVNSENINDFKVSPITEEILPILIEKDLID